MVRPILAAAILASAPVLLRAEAASATLLVTATVISTCRVDVPPWAEAATLATMPVAVTCAHGAITPRVQRPIVPRRIEVRDAVLTIDF